jgi:hypothetical protein
MGKGVVAPLPRSRKAKAKANLKPRIVPNSGDKTKKKILVRFLTGSAW